jgi:hypothetical protein
MSGSAGHLAAIVPLKGGSSGRIPPPKKGHCALCGACCEGRAPGPKSLERKDFGTFRCLGQCVGRCFGQQIAVFPGWGGPRGVGRFFLVNRWPFFRVGAPSSRFPPQRLWMSARRPVTCEAERGLT